MTLHREGKVIIPVSFLIIASIVGIVYYLTCCTAWQWLTYLLGAVGLLLFGLVLNFFRNPVLQITQDIQHILAPCDGKVVVIEEIDEPLYFKGKVRQISVFMSPLNVHVNRNPIGGIVKMFKYLPGQFLVAFDPKSSHLNERTFCVVENDKITVAYKQIAGYVARRICWYIKQGDSVEQGAEYGFIKFGSRIDILVPLDVAVNVKLEEVVFAGKTILAKIN